MNHLKLYLGYIMFISMQLNGQILDIKPVFQEQDQWCWAAVSKCVLDYYDIAMKQCEIAEYTRATARWHDFGQINCCTLPTGQCNYPNYGWSIKGSVQDILFTFGKIQNTGLSGAFSKDEIIKESNSCRPFIMAWEWTTGEGHFVVGYGIRDENIYYMDPWMGEGLKIGNYHWIKSSSIHNWVGTIIISTNPTLPSINTIFGDTLLIENPVNTLYSISSVPGAINYEWKIFPSFAGTIIGNETSVIIDFEDYYIGTVVVSSRGQNNCIYSEKDSIIIKIYPQVPVISLIDNMLISSAESGNQWYFNNRILTGANKQSYQATMKGEYYSIVTINSLSSLPSNIINYWPTDIPDYDSQNKIKIYPNPSTNIIIIKLIDAFNLDYTIEIYNESGNVIFSDSQGKDRIEFTLDINTYPTGTYLLRVFDEQKSYTSKIIKTKEQ